MPIWRSHTSIKQATFGFKHSLKFSSVTDLVAYLLTNGIWAILVNHLTCFFVYFGYFFTNFGMLGDKKHVLDPGNSIMLPLHTMKPSFTHFYPICTHFLCHSGYFKPLSSVWMCKKSQSIHFCWDLKSLYSFLIFVQLSGKISIAITNVKQYSILYFVIVEQKEN